MQLSVGDLRAGDILLHQPRNPKWYEKGIAWCTGSPYTHASIVVGDDTIAEARLPRIRTWSIRRTIKRENGLCVLRQQSDLTADQIGSLHDFVDKTLILGGRFDFAFPYTYYWHRLMHRRLNAFATAAWRSRPDPNEGRRYFCSSFVVACLWAMEIIDRSEHCIYRPGRHSPADFLNDEKFGRVLGHIPGARDRS